MTEQRLASVEDYVAAFPVLQSFHTGKWGWRRVGGCLNLNACSFATREEAEKDRGLPRNFCAFITQQLSR